LSNAHGELLKPTPEKRVAVGLQFAELDEGKWLDDGALTVAGKSLNSAPIVQDGLDRTNQGLVSQTRA
jgi:hypothetical protein